VSAPLLVSVLVLPIVSVASPVVPVVLVVLVASPVVLVASLLVASVVTTEVAASEVDASPELAVDVVGGSELEDVAAEPAVSLSDCVPPGSAVQAASRARSTRERRTDIVCMVRACSSVPPAGQSGTEAW
jgi:hypothetical protein